MLGGDAGREEHLGPNGVFPPRILFTAAQRHSVSIA